MSIGCRRCTAVALVVAALGITTTLTVLVLERTRELNTIYAVGGSLGQIRGMILWEAVFMVTIGEIGGLMCGFILSYHLVFVINRQSFGWTFGGGARGLHLKSLAKLNMRISGKSLSKCLKSSFRSKNHTGVSFIN